MGSRLNLFAPEDSSQYEEEPSMSGNESIESLREESETGNIPVAPLRPGAARRISHECECGFSPADAFSVRIHQPHGPLEFFSRNFRILRRNVLRSGIFDAVGREPLPVSDPDRAETAASVIDQDGLV